MAVSKKTEQSSDLQRRKILATAASMFITQGYTATSLRQLAKEADINIGSLMHQFETKENILSALMHTTMAVQSSTIEALLQGKTHDNILIWAAENALHLYMAETNEPLRDLYITAYSLPKTAEIIRRTIAEKAGECFLTYNPGYLAKDFYEMEIAAGSILRGFMSVPCDMYFTMESKIARYLESVFRIYRVPEEKAAEAIAFVSQFDFVQITQTVIQSLRASMAADI